MAYNLIENLSTAIHNANLAPKMAVYLGEDAAATKAGIDFTLPTVLSFIAKKSLNIEGAGSLLNVIRTGNHTGNILNTLPSLFDGRTNMRNYIEGGNKVIQNYVGPDSTRVLELLNKTSSFKKTESASTLMNLVTPIILSSISKQITLQDLPVAGLRDFMKEQTGYISSMLPKGISEIVGIAETEPKKKVTPTEKPTTSKEKVVSPKETAARMDPEPFPLRTTMLWLVGICSAIGLGYLTWQFLGNTPKNDTTLAQQIENAPSPESQIRPIADTPKTVINPAPTATPAPTPTGIVLGDGTVLNAPKGSLEEQMVSFIQNTADQNFKDRWLIFDRMAFEGETAVLKPESMTQLQNVAAIMKTYPRVSIKIAGFVDNATQQAFPKLSSQRSISVFRELMNLGVARKNVRADGYGSVLPLASNDTEEGRVKNRRVALTIKTK
jgi:OmpA-OmpF porin, OOP family